MARSQQRRRSPGRNSLRQPGQREVVKTLAKLKGLAGLPRNKLPILADRMAIRHFDKRTIIHRDGQTKVGYVYILLSGIGRLTCVNRRGGRVLLEVLGPGDIVGIPSLLPYARQNVSCEAFTACEVGKITLRSLVEEVVGVPFDHFKHALRLTSGRWWQLLVRHSIFIEQSLQQRVIHSLHEFGAKLGTQNANKTSVSIDLTHQELAHLVIASRAKVSACLAQLAAQHAIVQEGRNRIILDPQRLQAVTPL
jgi:CRP/FNR family transcriptional regulator